MKGNKYGNTIVMWMLLKYMELQLSADYKNIKLIN